MAYLLGNKMKIFHIYFVSIFHVNLNYLLYLYNLIYRQSSIIFNLSGFVFCYINTFFTLS